MFRVNITKAGFFETAEEAQEWASKNINDPNAAHILIECGECCINECACEEDENLSIKPDRTFN